MKIRGPVDGDLAPLAKIYNHYVVESHVTFDIEPIPLETRRSWLASFAESGPYRLLVAEEKGAPIGYASSSPFRAKAAYETSVETTIYLAPDATGRGLGRPLYTRLLDSLRDEDVHRAYGGVALPNPGSVALHASLGFRSVGVFREVGRKWGRYWDVEWFEKELG